MRRRVAVLAAAVSVAALGILFAVSRIDIGALPEPGGAESCLATSAKHVLVRRNSRGIVPPVMPDIRGSAAEGEILYGVDCAACHGLEGTKPTDAGRWMYPRAAILASPDVQRYSDAELYWIVKNGIRRTGMPGFGEVETEANIWNLVHYLRSLPANRQQATGHK